MQSLQRFVNHENIARYRELIAIAESDPSRDEARYQVAREEFGSD